MSHMEMTEKLIRILGLSAMIGPLIGVSLLAGYVYLRFRKKKRYVSLLWLGAAMLALAAVLFGIVLYLGFASGGFSS